MKEITVTIRDDWRARGSFLSHPVRYLEKTIISRLGVKLIHSGRSEMAFAVNEEEENRFYAEVLKIIKEDYGDSDPDSCVTFSVEDYTPLDVEAEKAAFAEARAEAEAAKAEAEAETKKDEPKEERDGNKEERKPEESKDAAKTPAKDEEEESVPYDLEELLSEVPMKHSEDMINYLRETDKVIPMLRKMNNERCIWTQNLLVSVDSGFGLTTFLKTLVKIHVNHKLVENKDNISSYFDEYELHKASHAEDEKKNWEQLFDYAKRKSMHAERGSFTVLCLDISEYISDLTTPGFSEKIKRLSDETKNYICVFRIPFMEKNIVSDIAELLGDTMNIRLLCVPPIPMEDMVGYMHNRLKKFGIDSDESCNESFERELILEKKDDSFFGYKTLNKVIDKIIYDKAVKNAETGKVDLRIESSDIQVADGFSDENDADPVAKLKELVGMEAVSKQILEIIAQMKYAKEASAKDDSFEKPSIHMMFSGNPGTGKTTVARIVAKIMKEQGILRKGYMHEYHGRDLCGRYIGETAPKTSAICRDAYGSVLFIDEAYSLYRGDDNTRDYGREALDTLVAEMENHRDDMCVIFAGYKDEMEIMLQGNIGLRSRIPYIIEFPNYTREQLVNIFFKMLGDRFKYDDSFKDALSDFFNELPDEFLETKEFSNARFVRNLYEKIWGKAAYRKMIENSDEVCLLKTDVENVINTEEFKNLVEKKNKKIGFV